VPRIPPQERLKAVAGAATRVFGRFGYRGTRTADVAAAAGMSSGSIFTYVESKEALFHLVFLSGFGHLDDGVPALPLPTPAPGATVELIAQELRKIPAPRLRAALAEHDPADIRSELHGIIEERYALIERLWPVLAVIERCAVDVPGLEDYYYARARVGFFRRLTQYLETRTAAGYLRPMPSADVAARVVSESISWFAWHRHEGRDALLYDDDTTRATVTEFVCAALLLEPEP
jgi:AcrR family transcriptional regulator